MASSSVVYSKAAACFQIHPADNVATMLQTTNGGPVHIFGNGNDQTIQLQDPIELGHKVAIRPIAARETIVKYGVPIGIATIPIAIGTWVHLHNCKSQLDERSGTMDVHTGLPGDTRYE